MKGPFTLFTFFLSKCRLLGFLAVCVFFKKYLFLAVLGLHFCARASSSCGEQGLLSTGGGWASHRSGSSHCGARALGAHGLRRCSSRVPEHRRGSRGAQA